MNERDIIKLKALLKKEDSNILSLWELIERFVVPFQGNFYQTKDSEGNMDWRKRQIYDSTAVVAAQTLAASLQGNLIPTGLLWFLLRFTDEELNQDHDASIWIEEVTQIVFKELENSNFNLEAAEALMNLVSFGSAVITEEFEDDGIIFKSFPIREVTFKENHEGQVDTLIRSFDWTYAQIMEKFETIPEQLKDADPLSETKYTVTFCVYERPHKEGDEEEPDITKPISDKLLPWGYKYVLDEGAELLKEGGYYEMPGFVARWRTTPGSKWGNSPAATVLSNILTLNEITESMLEATSKAIEPPIFTTKRGLVSDLNYGRRGLTVVKELDQVREFVTNARVDVGERRIQSLQDSINQAFHVDQLQMKESPAMTATEVNVRYELMQRLLGPTLGRIINDMLNPIIERTFNGLMRQGKLPDMPQAIKDRDSEYEISYSGPLPRSQKFAESQGIQQWLAFLAEMAQINPGVMDIPDFDGIARLTGKNMGTPEVLIKGDTVVKAERKRRDDSAANKNQADMQEGAAMEAQGKGIMAMKEAAGES